MPRFRPGSEGKMPGPLRSGLRAELKCQSKIQNPKSEIPMDDPFALLGLPRRPWLDPAAVRAAFQQRSRAAHPDAAGGDAGVFAALNAAQRELSVPASRLRRLLPGAVIPAAPPDIEMGFRIGAFLREADHALATHAAAKTPLDRALAIGTLAKARRVAADILAAVEAHQAEAHRQLRALDAAWPDIAEADLAALAGAFTFLDRWTAQLRDRRVSLEITGGPAV